MSSRSFFHSSSTTTKSVSITTGGTTRGGRVSSRRTITAMSEEDGSGEVFTVTQDFKSEDADSIGVHRGEKVVLIATKTSDPLISDYDSDEDDVSFGVHVEELLDSSAARHKMAVRPKRHYTRRTSPSRWAVQSLEDPSRKGLVPIVVLEAQEEETLEQQDIIFRKEAVINELLETEEEFCRDLKDVVERYIKPLDGAKVPRFVSDKKDSLFGNFREIAIFHNTVLLEGIKYYAKEPKGLGRAFLRMERDFDKHVAYCHDEPSFQEFLQENESIRNWFEDLAARLRDDKNLGEHLKLPVQRINDYQLLLKELVKYCEKLGEDTTDLEKALELMLGIPHRADDLKYLNNIEGYHGDIHKLGRLLRHGWFKVTGKDGKPHDRYLFLFKARILVCKVRKIGDNRYVFVLKEIIRLPEVELRDHRNDPKTFEVGPFTVTSHKDNAKDPWLAEIKHYAKNALTLAEHAADDLRLQIEENEKLEPLKGVELDLAFGQALSDEEMPKAPPPEPVIKTVEEPPPPKEPEPEPEPEKSPTPEPEVPEDTTSRCNIDISLFSKTVEGFNAEPGGTASFECEIEWELKSLIWLKDNEPFDEDLAGRVTQLSQGKLHRLEIADVRLSDAGVYTAHATLADGRVTSCTANLIVQPIDEASKNKPKFVVKLKDTELMETTFLRFLVKVEGVPNPEVQFYHNDVLITYKNSHCCIQTEQAATGYYELIIPEVARSDAGVYKCVATNQFGEATCEGIVSVVEDKKVFQGLGDRKAMDPEFQWIKDGKPFDPEERFKVLFQDQEDSLALVFTHVKPEDAGLYTCVASTSTGKISCSAELTVQGNVNLLFREPEAPKVTAVNKVQDTNIGSSAMLETKVTGYPKPDVKWVKDEKEVEYTERCKLLYEDDETIALVIKNVTLDDMGEYKAIAQNVTGTSEDTISLNVKAAPTFTKKLTDVHTISGQPIKLSVEIEANPKPMVAWYKDGKQILESEHVKLSEDGKTYTLEIASSSLYDVGSYSIVCKNNISQCSEFCKVDIEGAPIFTRNLIKRVETEEGDSLTFLVKVHGTPMPTVQWTFKGKPVVTDSRCKITSDNDTHTLTINAINALDAGEYSCTLTNLHGSLTDKGQVHVKTAPTFIKGMGHVMAQEGDTLVGFTVQVASFPKGKVRWFYNESEITESSSNFTFKEMEDNYTLIIKEVSASSAGKYRCKIENEYGSNESTADLTVLCRPTFKTGLKNVTVNEGDTLTLKVEIEGTPEPQIKWFKDGNELTESAHIKISRDKQRVETYELTVNLIKEEDGGEYEVRAVNEMGTAVTKSTVIVQATSSSRRDGLEANQRKESVVEDTSQLPVADEMKSEEPLNAKAFTREEKDVVQVDYTEDVGVTQDMETRDEDNFFEIVQTRRAVFSGYRCVEVTTESVLEESCCGIVEEFSDSEDKCSKLSVTRGVSILSVSDDEELLSPVLSRDTSSRRLFIRAVENDNDPQETGSVSPVTYTVKCPTHPLDTQCTVTKQEQRASSAVGEASDECTIIIQEDAPTEGVSHSDQISSARTRVTITERNEVDVAQNVIERTVIKIKEDETLLNEELVEAKTERSVSRSNLQHSKLPEEFTPEYKQTSEDIAVQSANGELSHLDDENHTGTGAPNYEPLDEVSKAGTEIQRKRSATILKEHIQRSNNEENESAGTTVDESECHVNGSPALPEKMFETGAVDGTAQKTAQKIVDKDLSIKGRTCEEEGVPLSNDDSEHGPSIVEMSPVETIATLTELNSKDVISDNSDELTDDGQSSNAELYDTLELEEDEVGTKSLRDVEALTKQTVASPASRDLAEAGNERTLEQEPLTEESPSTTKEKLDKKRNKLDDPENSRTADTVEPCDIIKSDASPTNSSHTHHDTLNIESSKAPDSEKPSHLGSESNVAPQLKKNHLEDVQLFETWEHKFIIEVHGIPKPIAKWTKDGHDLPTTERFRLSDDDEKYILEITDAQREDTGEYKVVVSNVLGEQTASANLKVVGAGDFRLPQILSPLKDLKVHKGHTSVLSIVVSADPIPDVKWEHDGKPVTPDCVTNLDSKISHHGLKECTATLTIPSSQHVDTGTYKFYAENKSGSCENSARLDVILKPEIKIFKDILGTPYEDSQFIAVINSNPRANITWRKDGNKITSSDHFIIDTDHENEVYKLKIKGILPEDAGMYTVSAVNEIGEASADARLKMHMEEPEFTKVLENVTVREYAPLDLKVRAQGVPKPEVQWSKDGVDLEITEGMTLDTRCEGSVSSHLSIPHFKEEYCGKYKVRAYSLAGHVDTTCYVKLAQLSPSFSKSLGRALEVEEGEPLELRCKVEASPIATVKWFKDGEELPASDRIQLIHSPDGHIKLRIEEATPADCGAYKLVVENALGADSSICAVAVNPSPRAPIFIKKLEDASIAEGQPLFLQAQVMGFPLPEMKWFKDGLPLRNSRSVNFINSPGGLVGLSVEKSASENAGNYSLTVTNRLGEATSTADVEVILKDRRPEFQGYLTPTAVVEGFPVKMTVKVGGNPPPELTWTRNGSPIDIDGERIKVVELPDGIVSLLIDSATPLDAGQYAVTATNSAGTITSEAKLDVVDHAHANMPEEAPSFGHALRDTWAEEGSMAFLAAPYLGNPVPEVKWFKNGKELSPDHRIAFTNDGHKVGLQIVPCAMDDVDSYKCKLINPLGEAESEAKLTVKKVFHAPVFTQKLRDLEQIIGLDGKLVCHVTGNPRPEISWFKNGKPVFEGNRYKMKRDGDNCILYIKDCSPDEDGYYKCIASNRDGKDETEAQFRAVEKISSKDKGEAPCFLKKIGDQELIQGMTGRFTACISGYPEPEVEWYRNNDKLYPSERITIEKESTGLLRLSIAHVDPDVDAGKYRVRIYNDHGEDECQASFIFDNLESRRPIGEQFKDFEEFKHTGAPMPLADRPIISRMADRRLTLSWKPSIPYGPREPVTYQVEMCELPNGDWFTARSGIRSCACEIRNLEPFRDYKFRVRVENKYGISDPSPYAMTYRSKLEPEPAGFIPYLAPGIDFRPESSPYFPKDFDIERPPHDGYAQAPRFLRQEHYTQYGVKGHNCNLFWFVYGYPKPKMAYFFNNDPIDMGGRYDCSYTRNGQATLFINKMLDRDVGTYEAVASNEHGEARQRVHLEIAEYPEFVKRPDEMTIVARHGGRLEARVVGVPQPEVKWFKDWQPLAATSRIKMNRIDPDHCNLVINEAIAKDAGLYSITASNVAGAVSCSVMVHIEEKDEHAFQHYGRGHGIKTKTKPIGDWYDLGDELGRGTQGVTYHAVERSTGRNFAAKIMHGRGELKSFMHNELEIMNQLNSHKIIRIHDAFETLTNVTLIIELAGGGEMLDAITRPPYTSESEIASYIRQLLVALDYLHDQNIAHLGLTPGDLLVSHPGGDDLRLADFGLARRIHPGQLQPLDYGMPEFVSPETIRGEGVDVSSDMWSVGVITYLLLTGVSLFRGANDKETLTKVREGFWEFDEEYWKNLSVEARDFVTKLLVVNVNDRMDVKTALRHPWLNYADRLPPNLYQIPTEKLHNYYNLWKDWYSNASCRTWYRRRPLTGAFNHPSKMVYPPHYVATPLPSPERDINEADSKKPKWTDDLPSKQPLNYDLGVITSESHYQNGPDTYLLQLRDVDFPVRIREYMKVAAHRGSGVTRFSEDSHLDWRLPVIRERRRFMDVMDEEIDDERKDRINQYGFGDSYTVRRLKHEIGSRLDTHVEAEAIIEASREGQPPFMREKPQITAIEDGKPASLSCYAVGDPKPTIQWYKNDMMFGSSNRVKIIEDDQGRSIVQFNPANSVDAGIYKVVARNRSGQTIARTRLVLAVVPDAPDSPQAVQMSDTQVLLKWKQPKVDGNSAVISYSLQYQQSEGTEWKEVSSTIDHEFYLVNRLKPATGYLFRLACRNAIGWSEPGIPSVVMRTLEEGCEKITLSPTMKHLQALSESGIPQEKNLLQREELDYSIERAPLTWLKQLPTDKYTFVSEICRGRFSVVVKGVDKTNDRVIVAKLCDYSPLGKPHVDSEFDTLKSLRHERIAALFEAYLPFDANYAVLIFEKLQGADVLTYLSSRHEYTEQMVATVIQQVLDGLQYLHWRNLCHLDVQPDNVVMASVRSLQVKLVDLGSAQRVTKLGNVVKSQGNTEFTAPEVLCQEPAYPQSDVWSVGVLAYVMLSGVSPFLGENPGETRQNINFVRFRFEHLYKELTQEATRFIMLLFKRAPTKRPSTEECQEHRWLLPSEYMIKRRERAVFLGSRIKEFSERYHQTKLEQASSIETLTNLVTGKDLQRSNSIVEELTTSNE